MADGLICHPPMHFTRLTLLPPPSVVQLFHRCAQAEYSLWLNPNRVRHRHECRRDGVGERLPDFLGQGRRGVGVGPAFRSVEKILDLPRFIILFFGDGGIHFGEGGREGICGKILGEIHAVGELRAQGVI